MSAAEFDAWASGGLNGAFEWTSADDQTERSQLAALRELETLIKERNRIERLVGLIPQLEVTEPSTAGDHEVGVLTRRKIETEKEIKRLTTYLSSAGWATERWLDLPSQS